MSAALLGVAAVALRDWNRALAAYVLGHASASPQARNLAAAALSVSNPYATYTTTGVKSVDNGWYEVYVEPNNGSDGWSTAKTLTGSITIAKAASQASLTRARVYGPYRLAPSGTVGAKLQTAAIFNSRGSITYGNAISLGRARTATTTGPNVFVSHGQGWCTDGTYNYHSDLLSIQKRARDGSATLLINNATPFAGLPSGATMNHVGDIKYRAADRVVYAAVCHVDGGGNPTLGGIAFWDAATLASRLDLYIDLGANFRFTSGGAVFDASGVMWLADYYDPTTLLRLSSAGVALGQVPINSTLFNQFQGIDIGADGNLWISASRNDPTVAKTVAVFTPAGVLVDEVLLTDVTGSTINEGLAFDVDGKLGVLTDNASTSTTHIQYYDVTRLSSFTAAGVDLQKNGNSFVRFLGASLPAAATVMVQGNPHSLYDFNYLWSGTGVVSKFNGWTYADGRVAGRTVISDNSIYTGPISANAELTMAWSYVSATGAEKLYVNGSQRVSRTTTTGRTWAASNDFATGGANLTEVGADSLRRYVYIFNQALTEAEEQGVEADPFSIWTPINALTAAQKTNVAKG